MIFPKENRVRVAVYGPLPGDSPLLVRVPTAPGHQPQYLHFLAAQGLATLSSAARFDLPHELPDGALVASGRRDRRYLTWAAYEAAMIRKYGSVEHGRKFVAFESPHETGLVVDFGCGGLSPVSATIDKQRQTPFYKWLCENAHEHGWTPYNVEPWHWEFNVPLEAYRAEHATCEAILDPWHDDEGAPEEPPTDKEPPDGVQTC